MSLALSKRIVPLAAALSIAATGAVLNPATALAQHKGVKHHVVTKHVTHTAAPKAGSACTKAELHKTAPKTGKVVLTCEKVGKSFKWVAKK